MSDNKENGTAFETAKILMQINAVKLNDKEPFTWASGRKAPIYCDNRLTLSYPAVRTYIRQEFVKLARELGSIDVVAAVATGGIPQGALVAQELGLPLVYVRSSAKSHGLGQQIEGDIKEGQRVLVIEDLISTGGSSLSAVAALREAGCDVKAMLAVFTYNLDVAKKAFEEANVPLYTLSNYNSLIEYAQNAGILMKEELESLAKWRENPEEWSNKRS